MRQEIWHGMFISDVGFALPQFAAAIVLVGRLLVGKYMYIRLPEVPRLTPYYNSRYLASHLKVDPDQAQLPGENKPGGLILRGHIRATLN